MPELWSWNNWVDENGTTYGGTGTTDFPVSNLALPQIGRIYRAATLGTAITFTFPGVRSISVIAGFGGNVAAGHRFTLRLSTAASGTIAASVR